MPTILYMNNITEEVKNAELIVVVKVEHEGHEYTPIIFFSSKEDFNLDMGALCNECPQEVVDFVLNEFLKIINASINELLDESNTEE